jgi:predicted nucleic-acid-binding Zn-ribbon protein
MAEQTTNSPSLQDFNLLKKHVNKATVDRRQNAGSLGFYFFAIDLILNIPEDDIEDSITDTYYLSKKENTTAGHDRGIDALYIDESDNPPTVHIFNCKYTEDFKKTSNHFPSNEIDKVVGFLQSVVSQNTNIKSEINNHLYSKVEYIWNIFKVQNPRFVIHLCSNYYKNLESSEAKRFTNDITRFSDTKIQYHNMTDFVSRLTEKGKQIVNARFRVTDRRFFDKSSGELRAIIAEINAIDLLRIVIDNETIRMNCDWTDDESLRKNPILEDAFEDNVRLYKSRSNINKNIKATALSDDSQKFFYYNNGITLTCTNFSYQDRKNTIVEINDLQVVNGSQTIHALYHAFLERPEQFDNIDLLIKIYETKNKELVNNIAEYTNSQNPVTSRDIRSNDNFQKKIGIELRVSGYYYERKKNQYPTQPINNRIDIEKAGQALLAFKNGLPADAKDKKRIIFAEKYDEIFSEDITADLILLIYRLYQSIEANKIERKKEIFDQHENYEEESFILHATYYILYVLSKYADKLGIPKINDNFQDIIHYYPDAINNIKKAIEQRKNELTGFKETYNHRTFFKEYDAKRILDRII